MQTARAIALFYYTIFAAKLQRFFLSNDGFVKISSSKAAAGLSSLRFWPVCATLKKKQSTRKGACQPNGSGRRIGGKEVLKMSEWTFLWSSGAALLLGLWLCFGGTLLRRLAWGVQTFLWVGAGLLLIFGLQHLIKPLSAAQALPWLAVIAAVAAICGLAAALRPQVGGGLTGFFVVFTVAVSLAWLTPGTSEQGILLVLIGLLGGLLLGVLSALWPGKAYWVWAPASGALFSAAAVTLLWNRVAVSGLYDWLWQHRAGSYLWQGIALGVLWAAGLTVQLRLAHRAKKRANTAAQAAATTQAAADAAAVRPGAAAAPANTDREAGIAAPPASAAAPQQTDAASTADTAAAPAAETAPAAPAAENTGWYCSACGAKNYAKFCTRCGHPR